MLAEVNAVDPKIPLGITMLKLVPSKPTDALEPVVIDAFGEAKENDGRIVGLAVAVTFAEAHQNVSFPALSYCKPFTRLFASQLLSVTVVEDFSTVRVGIAVEVLEISMLQFIVTLLLDAFRPETLYPSLQLISPELVGVTTFEPEIKLFE